jgi:hypothetical protein
MKLTTAPLIEQTLDDVASTVVETLRLDVEESATVYVAPPSVAALGCVDE